MEAQVENKCKKTNKQINKEKKRKEKKNIYVQTSITEKLQKWRKRILERKNLL